MSRPRFEYRNPPTGLAPFFDIVALWLESIRYCAWGNIGDVVVQNIGDIAQVDLNMLG
jgi:hypothetical protein